MFNRNVIAWSTKKQRTVALSSTEAEYRALTNATTKVMWIQTILWEIRIQARQQAKLWCDNIGANPIQLLMTE